VFHIVISLLPHPAMAGLWPSFLALLACLTGCLAIQAPAEWPSWVKLPARPKPAHPKKKASEPKNETLSETAISVTTAPPKPKNIFSDVDDVDFEPEGLLKATQTEEAGDWASELEEGGKEAAQTERFILPEKGVYPHTHSGAKKPCVLADWHMMPKEERFRMLKTALGTTSVLWNFACHKSETMYGCDPITDELKILSDKLATSFDSSEKRIQHDVWKWQVWVRNLNAVSDDIPFEEFWNILPKKDWKAITLHTLHKASWNPLEYQGMDMDAIEAMMELADRDQSGDVSHDEFKHFTVMASIVSLSPLVPNPECAHHLTGTSYFEKSLHDLMTWAGEYHPKFNQKFFHTQGYDPNHMKSPLPR